MLLPRNPTLGGPLTTSVSYDNQATIETAGADVALNWNFPLRNGNGLLWSSQATFLDYYETKQSPAVFDVLTDWAGSLGPNLSGTNPGAYDYRLFSSLGYFTERLGCQPALALPTLRQFGRVCERTGHQGEQRHRSGRWRGHPAQLHAAHGHRDR